LLAELSVAVAVAAAAIALLRVHFVPAALFLLVASLFHTANMEMVRALRTVIRLQTLMYAAGGTFLAGSVGEPAYLPYGVLLVTASLVFLVSWSRARPRRLRLPLMAGAIALISTVIFTPLPFHGSSWTDGSLVWRSLATSLAGEGPPLPAARVEIRDRSDADSFDRSVSTSTVRIADGRDGADGRDCDHPNVLLVVLEGMAGSYLRQSQEHTGVNDPVVMEHLSRIADEFLVFPNTLAPNQQTIRGLYALLTGDYPKLDFSTPKVYEYMDLPRTERPRPLPEILRQAGYHTTYLQAADLTYMSKDQVMEDMGFEEIIGREYFDDAYLFSRWGPDDKAFFEQSLAYLAQLDDQSGEAPWFVTLLNVGSHHPYTVPEDFASDYPDDRIAAVHYLDEALDDFYRGLRQEGLLDDTLLIVISDESHGVDRHSYGQYWIVGMIRGPGVDAGIDTRRVSQIDVPWTVVSYLGFGHVPRLIPRTDMLDRGARDAERVLVFGRFFSPTPDTVYKLFPDRRVQAYEPGPGLFSDRYDPMMLDQADAEVVLERLEEWRERESFYREFDRHIARRYVLPGNSWMFPPVPPRRSHS